MIKEATVTRISIASVLLFFSLTIAQRSYACRPFVNPKECSAKDVGNSVQNGVEQIGNTLEKARDDTRAEAERAAERTKQAADHLKAEAAEAERIAKKKLAEAEKAVRENLEAVVEVAVTIAVEIAGVVKNVTVKAGENLNDAKERASKGIEHLSTESFRQYQTLERNIEKVKTVGKVLERKITELKSQKSSMSILSGRPQYFNQISLDLDPSKISIANVSNTISTWDDFAEDAELGSASSVLSGVLDSVIGPVFDAIDRNVSSAGQYLDDKVIQPLSNKAAEFNQWVITAYHANAEELVRWGDYWADAEEGVRKLTWTGVEKELRPIGQWFETRMGLNHCKDDEVIIHGKRNRVNCLSENIDRLIVEVDLINGGATAIWVAFSNGLNGKISEAENFLKLVPDGFADPNGNTMSLTSGRLALRSVEALEEKLVCNTDFETNVPAPNGLYIDQLTTYKAAVQAEFESLSRAEVIEERHGIYLEYLKCSSIVTRGVATDTQGRRYTFTRELNIALARSSAPPDDSRQVVSINSSDGQHQNLLLYEDDYVNTSSTSTPSETPPGQEVDVSDPSYDAILGDLQNKQNTLQNELNDAKERQNACGNLMDIQILASQDVMEIDPGVLRTPEMNLCSRGGAGALANRLEKATSALGKLNIAGLGFADNLLAYAASKLGTGMIPDSECDRVPGLRSKMDALATSPVEATDAILRDHIQYSSTTEGYIAMACWSKAMKSRQNDPRKFKHVRDTIASAKNMSEEIGNKNVSYHIEQQKARADRIRDNLKSYTRPDLPTRVAALESADFALEMADEALQEGDTAGALDAVDYSKILLDVADLATDIGPVGSFKSFIALTTGRNPVTGEELHSWDYVFAAVDVLDWTGTTRAISRLGKYAYKIAQKGGKSKAIADKVVTAIQKNDSAIAKGLTDCLLSLSLNAIDPCEAAAKAKALGELSDNVVEGGRKVLPEAVKVGGKTAPDSEEFFSRALVLSDNTPENGKHILREGIGGARYEVDTGNKIRRNLDTSDEKVDFIDTVTGERIQLKGPFTKENMESLPSFQGPKQWAESVKNGYRPGVKMVVDLFSLSPAQRAEVKSILRTEMGAAADTIKYLE